MALERSPLLDACLRGDDAAVDALLAAGADVDEATPSDDAPLELLGHAFTVDDGGRTALMVAAGDMGEAHPAIVRALLAAGARVDRVSGSGSTALCYAAGAGSAETVRLLLDAGARLEPARALFTPLYCAVEQGHLAIADLILRRGARVDARIWTRATPLVGARSLALVRLLLRRGADPRARDRHGKTAAHHVLALAGDPVDALRALLARGADPDARDRDGVAPLHLAAAHRAGHAATALLLRAGARVDVRQRRDGQTPLLRACQLDCVDVATLLLDHGARLEARGHDGATPLAIAARNGSVALGRALLARGATGRDHARAVAVAARRDAFVELLDTHASVAPRRRATRPRA